MGGGHESAHSFPLSLSFHKRQQAVLQNSSLCTGRRRRSAMHNWRIFPQRQFRRKRGERGGSGEERVLSASSCAIPEKSNGPKIYSRMRLRSLRLSLPLSFACGGSQKSNLRERPANAGTDSGNAVALRRKNDFSPFLCSQRPGLWVQHPWSPVLAHLHAPIGNTFGRAADP